MLKVLRLGEIGWHYGTFFVVHVKVEKVGWYEHWVEDHVLRFLERYLDEVVALFP